MKKQLPNVLLCMILGIAGIVLTFFMMGLLPAIIGFFLSKSVLKQAAGNEQEFENYKSARQAFLLNKVALILNLLVFVGLAIIMIAFGYTMSEAFSHLRF